MFAISKHRAKCVTGMDSYTLIQTHEGDALIIIPTSQTGNLRLKKVKGLAQGHTVRKWALEPGGLASDLGIRSD